MKITLAQNAGFCEGVKRAFEMAERKNRRENGPLFVLGPLVHNEEVIKYLKKQGIKEVDNLKNAKKGTVIISAHGVSPDILKKIKKNKLSICDATCPKVIRVQTIAELSKEKNIPLIIIGDKKHREVIGVLGWAKKAEVISEVKDIVAIKFDKDKPVNLVSQTTQNTEKVKIIISSLKNLFSKLKVYHTVCLATEKRQMEIRKLASENDAIVVIGSKTSANSQRLFEIARELNSKVYFVGKSSELKKSNFLDTRTVAVTAGASTPDWTIRKVMGKLRTM